MGWGVPLGFSSGKTPFEKISSAAHGEAGWYCRFKQKPTDELPLRAMLKTPCASAVFDHPEDAQLFLEHPGEISELARRYIAWALRGENPATDTVATVER